MARTTAYVLMEVTAGHVPTVAAALRGMPGLVSVDSVMGPFDIIFGGARRWPDRRGVTSSPNMCTASAELCAP